METEVKRIVQVIEQYPETGKKVYQIVYEEFQKFLSRFLTDKGENQKVVSVAQQVEQKETLAIQYTIEMRNMLKDMPVRDDIRDFLFKVWAEVLAVSALRKGAKHADTQSLKKCATDLVWAASAKPGRAERARVIQDLPNLLLRLRSGMTLLAMAPSEQEGHVKKISDTLADAFLSKTQAIPQEKIDAMAQRLSNLEDFVSDDVMGDLPLDSESLEMMLGIDASAIEVVSVGGSKPNAAMLAWAAELQLGSWYTLDHNRQITQVQFAWRSERKHLNLFASTTGTSYLIQAGRLAAYLQAGLLLPQEEEALTVRATRDALAKIEANPERLLA
jgi:predicted Zn-dependent protease with MMP-like domain